MPYFHLFAAADGTITADDLYYPKDLRAGGPRIVSSTGEIVGCT